jgi:hypothetical protein
LTDDGTTRADDDSRLAGADPPAGVNRHARALPRDFPADPS